MKVLVVFESMYGNTHAIAEAIARGCARSSDVEVVPVGDATAERLTGADVVLVGGPTHVHGESWANTREDARKQAEKVPACATGSTTSIASTVSPPPPSTPASTATRL
jgi:flavodoxin